MVLRAAPGPAATHPQQPPPLVTCAVLGYDLAEGLLNMPLMQSVGLGHARKIWHVSVLMTRHDHRDWFGDRGDRRYGTTIEVWFAPAYPEHAGGVKITGWSEDRVAAAQWCGKGFAHPKQCNVRSH